MLSKTSFTKLLVLKKADAKELITIYSSNITSCGGMRKMKKWLISARVMLGSAADPLSSHIDEICNYFNNRTTSGVTEGINTRIKLIIRQSYGFKNFDLMKEKLLARLYLNNFRFTPIIQISNTYHHISGRANRRHQIEEIE
jgi:Transposase